MSQSDFRIVPNEKQIGPIRIGMTLAWIGILLALSCRESGYAKRGYDAAVFQRAMAQSDYRIVGSEHRVGPIRLGMYMDEVIAILGQPETIGQVKSILGNGRWVLWTYDKKNFEIRFSDLPAPFVEQIDVWGDSKFVTDEGIRVGMSMFDAARAYGRENLPYVCLVPGVRLFISGIGDESNRIHLLSLYIYNDSRFPVFNRQMSKTAS